MRRTLDEQREQEKRAKDIERKRLRCIDREDLIDELLDARARLELCEEYSKRMLFLIPTRPAGAADFIKSVE